MKLPDQIAIHSNMPFAARELAGYLRRATGREPSLSGEGFPIRILAGAGQGESYRIEIGDEGISISSPGARGVVYGVYDFLERDIGCRFFAEDCEIVPALGDIDLRRGARECAPAFAYREVYWRGALDGRFALKCRLNSARAHILPEWGGRVGFYNYSHSFDELVPPDDYFDSHPEYFSQVNGKRIKGKTQLCLTNPDVLKLCIEKVRGWMRARPDLTIFSVAQNDWYHPCECESCRAVDEREDSHAGTLIHFVNRVADALAPEFPDNFIHTFAYLYTRRPPRHVWPRPNVIVRLCGIENCFSHPMAECDYAVDDIDVEQTSVRAFRQTDERFERDLLAWSGRCDQLYVWDYTTNFANYLQPFPNLHVLQPNMRMYRARGVKGVFAQGNYAPGKCSAFGALKIYLLSKLMWDPDADIERHAGEFLRGYYGAPAEAQLSACIERMQRAAEGGHMSLFDGADAAYLTDDALNEADGLLARALGDTENADHRERIERERLSTRYVRLVRLPLDAPGRGALIDAFAADARRLGIGELFERRELDASFECMKNSRYAADRRNVPYAVYRL